MRSSGWSPRLTMTSIPGGGGTRIWRKERSSSRSRWLITSLTGSPAGFHRRPRLSAWTTPPPRTLSARGEIYEGRAPSPSREGREKLGRLEIVLAVEGQLGDRLPDVLHREMILGFDRRTGPERI